MLLILWQGPSLICYQQGKIAVCITRTVMRFPFHMLSNRL